MGVRRTQAEITPTLEARLLGGCALRYDGRAVPASAFRRKRTLTLLLWLLITPGHSLAREAALELLWPDADPKMSGQGLRELLKDVRQALGAGPGDPPVVRSRGTTLTLSRPDLALDLDVDTFEAAATAALAGGGLEALRAAAALYTGPLLPGLPYEEWVGPRREALADLYRRVLVALARAEAAVDPAGAEAPLRALVTADPTDEDAARDLMRVLADTGRRPEALRLYEALARALKEELDVTPAPQTVALHAQLLQAPPTTNLPEPLTSFVGRARELEEVKDLLRRVPDDGGGRLVTLTGAGGCGKTRLALRVARELLADYPEGVWLVELAALTEPALVPNAVAGVLGLREEVGRPLPATLADYLKDRRLLLVLDNCEHLVGACAALADSLLGGCPRLQILATSREGLEAAGEVKYRVPSLSVPDPNRLPAISRLPEFEAVRLFVERARARQPRFGLTEVNARAVVEVCRRLDGIPLAIELAAARIDALGVAQIAGRLHDAMRLLTGGPRTATPRQQTLRATLEWSWRLLDPAEQMLLRRLSVFAGGWCMAAAETVCADEDTSRSLMTRGSIAHAHDDDVSSGSSSVPPCLRASVVNVTVLDLLGSLVNKSLVQAREAGGDMRYGLLETVRQYAGERLSEVGETAAARDRHLAWCRDLALAAKAPLGGPEQQTWLVRLDDEHDNIRAALRWSLHDAERSVYGEEIVGAIWRYWRARGLMREGMDWFDRLVAVGGERVSLVRARACNAAAGLAMLQGEFPRAEAYSGAALAVNEALGDQAGITASLLNLAIALREQGEYSQAAQIYERVLPSLEATGRPINVASVLDALGTLARYQGDWSTAGERYRAALQLYRQVGHQVGIANSYINMGEHAYIVGDCREARRRMEEALGIFTGLHDVTGRTIALANLAAISIELGDPDAAACHNAEARALAEQHDLTRELALVERNEGMLTLMNGDPDAASSLLRSALRRYRASREVSAICDILISLAGVALRQNDPARAAAIVQAVTTYSAAGTIALTQPTLRAIDRCRSALAGALSDAQRREAEQLGTSMPFDELVRRVLDNQELRS